MLHNHLRIAFADMGTHLIPIERAKSPENNTIPFQKLFAKQYKRENTTNKLQAPNSESTNRVEVLRTMTLGFIAGILICMGGLIRNNSTGYHCFCWGA